jgi:DNA-binding CsgD family transcriptional regulator
MEFREVAKLFITSFNRPSFWENVDKGGGTTQETTQEKIIACLRAESTLTRKLLAQRIGISENGVKYHLNKDQAALKARLAKTDAILAAIGGQLAEAKDRGLILKKLYDLVCNELKRYLNAEKRRLIAVVENLWDKYGVSSRELESRRAETLMTLDGFLKGLEYLKKEVP